MPYKFMNERPSVKLGDWIIVGEGFGNEKHAVVCRVYSDDPLGDIEVIYLDNRNRAINEDVVWKEDYWGFKHPGASGGYADRYTRLRRFVALLRRGRPT
jgi:hypothetical protein